MIGGVVHGVIRPPVRGYAPDKGGGGQPTRYAFTYNGQPFTFGNVAFTYGAP